MTELAVSTEATLATPLAVHLSAQGAELAAYRGVLTPQHFDAATAETEALLTSAAVHDLGWLRRVAVGGEDRFRWLSGMVTNAVEALPDQSGAYNLVLNAQGRIQGDVVVWRRGDTLALQIEAGQADALLTHLDHYIIMDDVELVPVTGESTLGLTGPEAERILTTLGLPAPSTEWTVADGAVGPIAVKVERCHGSLVPHFALNLAAEQVPTLWQTLLTAGAKPVGSAALETLRVVEGIPAYGVDIQSRDLAQETSQMRALNFTKGCYLGQEIVERIRSRGQVHRHLRSLELFPDNPGALPGQLPEPGAEIRLTGGAADAKAAATLTSVAALQLKGGDRVFAIGMIRAEAEIGDAQLSYAGGTARILYSNPSLTTA